MMVSAQQTIIDHWGIASSLLHDPEVSLRTLKETYRRSLAPLLLQLFQVHHQRTGACEEERQPGPVKPMLVRGSLQEGGQLLPHAKAERAMDGAARTVASFHRC